MSERLNLASSGGKDQEDDEYECQVCNANLFVSLVRIRRNTCSKVSYCLLQIANEEEDSTFCVEHGMEYVRNYPKKVCDHKKGVFHNVHVSRRSHAN